MHVLESLWASVQGDPVFMRRVNGWLTILWIVMIPASLMTGWVHSVVFVSALSLWALVAGHWSAWQAARVEVNQEHETKKRAREDGPKAIVDAIVDQTNIRRS
ncbi:MAG: hypothetical protein JWM66_208 [Solirubrobacterales bacterium]|jgi:hypothetical protein|nr:hypothetical protein [Solirubrobacterales bacterium]